MSTLSACIKKAGKAISQGDAAAITTIRDSLKADGMKAQEAAIEAVKMHIADLVAERVELGIHVDPEIRMVDRDPGQVANAGGVGQAALVQPATPKRRSGEGLHCHQPDTLLRAEVHHALLIGISVKKVVGDQPILDEPHFPVGFRHR